jgi:hypothetical protein
VHVRRRARIDIVVERIGPEAILIESRVDPPIDDQRVVVTVTAPAG